ncbi:MAG: THUMP domain-containing class I SAM-dependent RNA methyltransferase [Thermoanaerobaculaceae bacterium]
MLCVATCSKGLESVLASELTALGKHPVIGSGAVKFDGDWEDVVTANFWLRTAIRVLVELGGGPCQHQGDLYQLAAHIAWEEIIPPEATVAVQVAGQHPAFHNTHFAALVVKDGLVDRLREKRGLRPAVNVSNPDVRIRVHLQAKAATILLDTSGEPLSHRKYRPRQAAAPLSEALAAGLLLLAGYDGRQPFLDPMCGSGTLVVEAWLIARNIPPGRNRSFALQKLPFVDPKLLREARERANQLVRPAEQPIVGQDWDQRALNQARQAAFAAGAAQEVVFVRGDARQLPRVVPGTLIVSNPPYGARLGDEAKLRSFYRALGDAFKTSAQGSTVWLLSGNLSLLKEVGLQAQRKHTVFNGPLACRFCCYPIVEGSYRKPRLKLSPPAKV